MRALISLVMCGITCTVSPRYSPRRSLAMTVGVDLAGGDVRRAVQVGVEEPLVVADVEVGLGAVVGDEDLAVLERVHRAGVDVEVGVELLHRDAQAAGAQQVAEARGGQALAERGGDAAGDEDVLGRRRCGQQRLPWFGSPVCARWRNADVRRMGKPIPSTDLENISPFRWRRCRPRRDTCRAPARRRPRRDRSHPRARLPARPARGPARCRPRAATRVDR